MNKTLYIISGPQGSGKTSWCKKQLTTLGKHCVHVSRDEIRFSLLTDGEGYFAKEKETYTKFIEHINNFLKDNITDTILADATFLTDKSRKKFLKRLELNENIKIKLIIMDTSLYTCLRRNDSRTGKEFVPIDTVITAWEIFERRTTIERINETVVIGGEDAFYHN